MCILSGAALAGCGGCMRVGRSVLLLEDDDALLHLFEKILHRAGFQVSSTATTLDAQTVLSEQHFDIVVCDLSVAGGRNVFDFVSAARTCRPEIPILIVTGYTPEEIATRAQTIGLEMLEKPFSPPDLVRRIASMLDQKAA